MAYCVIICPEETRKAYHAPDDLYAADNIPEAIFNEKDKFQVYLDVARYRPEDIKVKEVQQTLIVSGEHKEQPDAHRFVKRQFVRKYILPKEVSWSDMTCNVSREGILSIEAPKHELTQLEAQRKYRYGETDEPRMGRRFTE